MKKHANNSELKEAVYQFLKEEPTYASSAYVLSHALLRFHESEDGAMLLSFSQEYYVDGGTTLNDRRYWAEVKLRCLGLDVMVKFPYSRLDSGRHNTSRWYPVDIDGFADMLRLHRPRKPFPLPLDDPKKPVQFVEVSSFARTPGDPDAEWTTPGRPVAVLNTLLQGTGHPKLDTKQGNELLARLDELMESKRPRAYFIDEDPSWVYSNDPAAHYTSCMAGEPACWFRLYDALKEKGKLGMMGIDVGGERVGRALVWFGSNPDDTYLDRVYAPGHRSTFDRSIVKAVMDFCSEHGITKTVHDQTANWFGLLRVGRFKLDTEGLEPESFTHYPYVDSMCYFGYDGWLYNYQPRGHFITMQATDGGAEGLDDYVELHDGERVHEDEACYVPRHEAYYLARDCSYSSYLNETVVDDESVRTYDGRLIWADDAVELHDGEYTNDDDSDLITLHDGSYAIAGSSEVIELHDGDFILDDGRIPYVVLHDGEFALEDDGDVVELHDGRFALSGDCVEVDGLWYLEGEQPES